MSLSATGPMMIQLPVSRSGSPLPPPSSEQTPTGSKDTPTMSRERSDTLSSETSSASLPYLQTPPTPSVLAIRHESGSSVDHRRKPNYGFGQALSMSPVELGWANHGHHQHQHQYSDHTAHTQALTSSADPSSTNQPRSTDSYFTLAPPISSGLEPQSPRLEPQTLLPSSSSPSSPSTPTEETGSVHVIDAPALAELAGRLAPKDKTIRATVRRKLERAKTLFRSRRDDEDAVEPRRSMLKSLFSSASRSQSTLSIPSLASMTGNRPPSPASLEHNSALAMPSHPVQPAQRISTTTTNGYDDHEMRVGDVAEREKGKRRAYSSHLQPHKRPVLLTAVTVSPAPPSPTSVDTCIEPSHASFLPAASANGPRVSVSSDVQETERTKPCFFDEMLPTELKIRILRSLLDLHTHEQGNGRWIGKNSGPRELIRLSRVSKGWQSLCFDGQLWSMSDLSPFADVLPRDTLRRILFSTSSYFKTLSLRGMDNIQDLLLVPNLARQPGGLALPHLTHLDLRGCGSIASLDICQILFSAPGLRAVNLRGIKAVTSSVVSILERLEYIETLDLSRCNSISLTDVRFYLGAISDGQAGRLRILRIGAVKGWGGYAEQVLPLIAKRLNNLETLDLNGSHHLQIDHIKAFTSAIAATGFPSPIQHLVLTDCRLGTEEIGGMIGKFPYLTRLEMAALSDWHHDSQQPSDAIFARFLDSCPLLQKVDLEGMFTPLAGLTIEALIPSKKAVGPVLGTELVELQVGGAKSVTPETFIRLVRACPKLMVLGCNNTRANAAVMRDFLRRRTAPASINMVDCRNIDSAEYNSIAHSTRPRTGWTGYQAAPFGYGERDLAHQVAVKTYWSWRRVGVPRGWRESLADAGVCGVTSGDEVAGLSKGSMTRRMGMRRRASWWRTLPDEEDLDRGSCIIM